MNRFLSRCCSVLLAVLLSAAAAGAQLPKDYYCNARFGFCIQYDPALLKRQPESHNGDGCVFKDKEGRVRLTVSGSGDWNFGNDGEVISLAELYKKELADAGTVTYKVFKKDYFIISGTARGEVFYKKVVKRKDAFCFAILQYPQAQQAQFGGMAERIARTFR